MRVVTWNIRKANPNIEVWNILSKYNPDIMLLQEVTDIPSYIKQSCKYEFRKAINKKGNLQKFGTAVLAKSENISTIKLISEFDWVDKELQFFEGNLVACTVIVTNEEPLNVIFVYSPAWPISKERLINIDVSTVKLQLNKELWCTEILWSALKNKSSINNYNWLIGGDFNSSETFDYLWPGGPRGNKEIIERMNSLDLTECLRGFQQKLTPTFKNSRGDKVIHQIDHLYASNNLYKTLSSCITGNAKDIFENRLSDHLPIIADFE